jgi:hypothetical protein
MAVPASPVALQPAARSRINASYAALPLAFETNRGQTDPQVKYMARAGGYTLFLTSSEAVFSLRSASSSGNRLSTIARALEKHDRNSAPTRAAQKDSTAVVRMRLLGGNSQAKISASDKVPGKINYYIGNDPKKWQTGVEQYARVSYHDVYPGVDLAFHGAQRQLEFDFVVAPGADTEQIELGFTGAKRLATDAAGNLVLSSAAGNVLLHKPVACQERDGKRLPVDAGFVVKNNEVAFALGSYDRSRELVIDPALSYATYLGGSGEDDAFAIAVDASGSAYVTGQTKSPNFPANPGTVSSSGGFDAFVSKLNATATALDFTTLIGGSNGDDVGVGIALNATGAYIVGNTTSNNFPFTVSIPPGGGQDLFVSQLDKTSGALLHTTKIGGTGTDIANAIAVDAAGNAYIGGETQSTDFPTVSPIQSTNGGSDGGFVAKLNAAGVALAFSTYLGGSSGDLVAGIALDSVGTPTNVFVAGVTASSDFPTTAGVFQTGSGGSDDGFVAAIKANGSALTYSTYLGGSGHDSALGIAVDSAGEAYVTGSTDSSNFPTVNAAQSTFGGATDVFVTKLNATGSALLFSTYLGGTLDESGTGIALDSFGDPYVTGRTSSSNFPVGGSPFQGSLSGTSDAFITELANTGFVEYASFLGGTGSENGIGTPSQAIGAVAVDTTSNVYLTGNTNSTTGVPVSVGAVQPNYGGGLADALIAKVGAAPADFSVAVSPTSVSVTSGQTTSTVTVTVSAVNAVFGNPVTLSCSGKPSKAACHFSTTSVTPGNSSATATLTISTDGSSGNGVLIPPTTHPSGLFYALLLPLSSLSLVGLRFVPYRSGRRVLGFLILGLVMTALFLLPACGGGGGGGGHCSAVPGVPTSLAASSTTSTGTTLNWSPVSAPSGCSITGYTVYRNGTSIGTTSNTNFAVTGLSPATSYSFTVAASDSAGISAQSSAVSVTTAGGGNDTPPGTYTITVNGAAGGATHSAQLTLKVN